MGACTIMKALMVILVIGVVVEATPFRRLRRSTRSEYRMCVPEVILDECVEMSQQETKSAVKIVCIPARDRIECISKIKQRLADFGTVDPEDMYVAGNVPNQDFAIFEEIRTKEEPDAEFRYEAVVVIHKDLKLEGIEGIRGLNSCHTGVGRNVGYKVPLTKLKKMGIIGLLNEADLSPRENELKAFSTLFSNACIVGKWSPDPTIDGKLKDKYPNLCRLCEHPNKCDYPDKFSGYDGALRCLAHNGGQIAWTKVIYVRKFFGLPVGVTPAQPSDENPDDYAYLCRDGTRVPVREKPCTWAARPWQGYMTNADVVKTVDELRRKIENLNTVGTKSHAAWLEQVLELNNKTLPRENKIIGPRDYLDKANYTDVVERDYGPPIKTVRFCVVSSSEYEKCKAFSQAAFSRNVRPRFDCVQETKVDQCLQTIRDNGADIISLDPVAVENASKLYNLKPIVAEKYSGSDNSFYAVAVVRKASPIKTFGDLRGAKSCLSGTYQIAGYVAPLNTLLSKDLIGAGKCLSSKTLLDFFGESCLPGVKDVEGQQTVQKLCSNTEEAESYSGLTGPLRCLVEKSADVAFVEHGALLNITDGKNRAPWAANLKPEDFELLCPDGRRAPIDKYETCNLLQSPPNMIVTSNAKGDNEVDEIRNALLSASAIYSKKPGLFRMFGPFNGKHDLLFKDTTIDLVSTDGQSDIQNKFSGILASVYSCPKTNK